MSQFIKRFLGTLFRASLFIIGFTTLLTACSSLPINKQPSVGQNARIQSLILHFTALNYERSMWALKDSGGVSSHYLIPELNDPSYPNSSLEVIQLVDESQRAWHAGISYWDGRENLNDTSIGIEVVNIPTCLHKPVVRHTHGGEYGAHKDCQFPDFEAQQIQLLIKLSTAILQRHPDIEPTRVIGHSDISPSRKNDPGPQFPWYELYLNGIGAWYEQETVFKYLQEFESFTPSVNLVQKALAYYGYKIKETGVLDSQTQDVLFAFQSHFLPTKVTGELNLITTATVFALLEKYKQGRLDVLTKRYYKEVDDELAFSARLTPSASALNRKSRYSKNSSQIVQSFYGASGQGALVLMHPELSSLAELQVLINGKKVDLKSSLAVNRTGIKVDLSDAVNNGNNVLTIKADSDLSLMTMQLIAPTLIPPTRWLDRKLKNELVNGLSKLEHSFEFSLVQHNKLIVHHAFGETVLNSNIELSQLTTFYTTQLAVLKLIGDKRLTLDRAVSYYLPDYTSDGRGNRTIRHLLNHNSGYPTVDNYLKAKQEQSTTNPIIENDELIDWPQLIYTVPFYYGVNQKVNYSEFNDLVLRLVIEQVTNMPFDVFINNEVLLPLELENTFFSQSEHNNTSPIQTLTSQVDDITVITQLFKNGGSYGKQHIFKPSQYSNWFQHNSFWLLATEHHKATKQVSIQQCHPYLNQNSHIALNDNGLVLVDDKLDISLIIHFPTGNISEKQRLQSNKCGLSQQQQEVLTKVFEILYQAQG